MSETANDSDLVSASLSGNRDAFGQIVGRYQSLVCSLAYSATGNLTQSEDLAQETFVTAWRQLAKLDEPQKLRAWLCGIARNLINNSLRKHGREPSHRAEPLEEISESQSPDPLPIDRAISKEEAEILWRSLERIPEIYREPLVLFYRENQSIETVAQNLDLTEDAVKQRLSRGRKLLHEQVLAFVEGALGRTNPGKVFTLAVLAALPSLTMTAKAGIIGSTAAKGSAAAAKAAGFGFMSAVLSPLFVLFGNFLPYCIGMAEARSDEERQRIKSFYRKLMGWSLGVSAVIVGMVYWMFHEKNPKDFVGLELFQLCFMVFVVVYLIGMFSHALLNGRQRKIESAKILAKDHAGIFPAAAWEYRSKTKFLGLPLVHIRVGDRFDLLRGPVKGWFAMGNYAIGGIAAFGGIALAPLCIGGIPFGVFSLGGLAFGIVPIGAMTVGVWACGAIAVGWQAYGAVSVGWNVATGNIALAHDFATGAFAHAIQANTDIAREYIDSRPFLRWIQSTNRHSILMHLLWITPLFVQWQIISRKNKSKSDIAPVAHQSPQS
ncbi:MAG TPA: sigma-70 family RNA polymerase sigma factor [Verrucomicrobiae bacterium]|nr:sigma-70 family RNA polymerase sigma factor [Verrucomicrobiae bacterium]